MLPIPRNFWGGCSVGSGEGRLTKGTGDVIFSGVGIARTVFGGFWWGYLVWAPRCSRLGVLGRGIRTREVGVFGRPLSFSLGGGECVCSSLWLWCSHAGRLPRACLVSTASCSLAMLSVFAGLGLSWCTFAL